MACETRQRMIGGEQWSCTQMAASRALALESRLLPAALQVVGPIIAALGQPDELQIAGINQAFAALAKALPPAEFSSIMRELCDEAFCNGQKVDFESKFSGGKGVALRYQVAWFVLETNFSDFFSDLLPAGVADRAQEAMLKRMAAPGAVAA